MYISVITRILAGAIVDLFYFPIWWYSIGVAHAFRGSAALLRSGNATLAPGLWLQNLFVPMFGQYDIQGRIVSFFMRLVQIIARTVALLFWFVICLAIFCAWLLMPAVIIYGLFHYKTVASV